MSTSSPLPPAAGHDHAADLTWARDFGVAPLAPDAVHAHLRGATGLASALESVWLLVPALRLMIDVGDGAQRMLGKRLGVPRVLALTHGHGDHVYGLFAFLGQRTTHTLRSGGPITVVYPAEYHKIGQLRQMAESFGFGPDRGVTWVPLRTEGGPVETFPLGGRRTLVPFRVPHRPNMPSVGYAVIEARTRLSAAGRALPEAERKARLATAERDALQERFEHPLFVHTGDTGAMVGTVDLTPFVGADVLVHDVTFLVAADAVRPAKPAKGGVAAAAAAAPEAEEPDEAADDAPEGEAAGEPAEFPPTGGAPKLAVPLPHATVAEAVAAAAIIRPKVFVFHHLSQRYDRATLAADPRAARDAARGAGGPPPAPAAPPGPPGRPPARRSPRRGGRPATPRRAPPSTRPRGGCGTVRPGRSSGPARRRVGAKADDARRRRAGRAFGCAPRVRSAGGPGAPGTGRGARRRDRAPFRSPTSHATRRIPFPKFPWPTRSTTASSRR